MLHNIDMNTAEVRRITEHVHAYVQLPGGWWLSNAGIVAGDEGAVLIDTAATQSRTEDLLTAAGSVTGQAGVSACVLTHAHGDHAGGLSLLGGARIYSAAPAADNLAARGLDHWPELFPAVEWGEIDAVVPDTTVAASDSFDTRIVEARTRLFARALRSPAHSTGDCVAWLPDEKVLFTGDLVWWGVTPLCVMGSIRNWRDSLDSLLALEPEVVVPGHGTPSDERSITRTRDYLDELLTAARTAVRQGWSATQAASHIYFRSVAGWLEPERHVVNLHHAIAELKSETVDIPEAVRDLLVAHGGRIPTAL